MDRDAAGVRALRERLGLTQQELAGRLGVSVAAVHRWETGKAKPSRMATRMLQDLDKRTRGKARAAA